MNPLSAPFVLHQTALAQHRQMTRDFWLRKLECLGQFADTQAELSMEQQRASQSRGIGQELEKMFRIHCTNDSKYLPIRIYGIPYLG